MKKSFLIAGLAAAVGSCTANPAIGGLNDAHGCSVSSGQTWSVLRNNCIRVFDDGIRLNPVKNTGSAVISAFVVFNDEHSKAELFIPSAGNTVVIGKRSEGIFADSRYQYNEKTGTLTKDGTAIYRR